MALDPKDQILMRDAFYEALDRWGSKKGGAAVLGGAGGGAPGGASPIATGSSIAGKALESLGGVAKGVIGASIDLSGRLAKGGLSVTDATKVLSDNLTKAGGIGESLAGKLGKGIDAFGGIINYVEEGVDVFRELSQTGATFNNSVVDMRAAAAGSRLTMREFGQIIKDNNTSFLALGESGEQGAKAFGRLSKQFFDSGFGDKLTQLGYSSEDLNKLMAIQMTNMSARELKEKGGAEAQFQSTVRLAEEMDLMAKLTGKSRKEQEEALAKAKASGQVQAAVQLEAMNGNAKAGEAFDAVVTSTSGKFGELIQQMVSAGRPLTDEGRKYMGMLSQDTQKAIQEARDAYKRGDVEGAREAAKRAQALESAEAATNKSRLALAAQGVKGFEESTQEGIRYGKALAEKARELGTSVTDPKAIEAARKSLEDQAKKEQAARSGETASVIEAQNRIKDMGSAIQESIIVPLKDEANKKALNDFYKTLADLNQSKAKGGTATSDKGFSGDVSQAFDNIKKELLSVLRGFNEKGPDQRFSSDAAKAQNQAQQEALRKAVAGRKEGITEKEAQEIREFSKSLKAVDGEAISKRIAEIAEKSGKTQEQVIAEAVNKPGGIGNLRSQLSEDPAAGRVTQQAGEATRREQDAAEATRIAREKGRETTGTSGDTLLKGAKSALESVGSLTTKTIDLFKVDGNLNIDGVGIGRRAVGGFIGKPEISLIGEEGPEWVLNKEQMAATLEGAANRGMEQMSKLLPSLDIHSQEENFKAAYESMMSMGPPRGNPTAGAEGLDLSSISKSITTSISSVAGGNVTTSKRTQSDESKSAEAEMDELRTKFFEDWAKRKEVLIEGMAVEDRKYSKVQAAMKADETAMKIKEEYEKKKEELQKKIDDGIKWEIETKEKALETEQTSLNEHLKLQLAANGVIIASEEERMKIAMQSSSKVEELTKKVTTDGSPFKAPTGAIAGAPSFDDIFKPVRMSAQSMMEKFGKENEDKKTAEQKAEAAKKDPKAPGAQPKKEDKPQAVPATNKGAATLDDVVSRLELLNKHMGQLIAQNEDLGKKQIRATKSNAVQP